MAKRKIELMHELFGKADGTCGECIHLIEGKYHGKPLKKCEVYGLTHSEASDWAKRYRACGLKNKYTTRENIIRLVRPDRKVAVDPMDGQVEMEAL